jgi:hypothetical protein
MNEIEQQRDQDLRDYFGLPDCHCGEVGCPEVMLALYGCDEIGPMVEAEYEQRLEPVFEALREAVGFEDEEVNNAALSEMLAGAFDSAVFEAATSEVVGRVIAGEVPFPPKGV